MPRVVWVGTMAFFVKCIEEPTGCEDSEYCQWFLCSTILIFFLLSGLLSNEC